MILYVCMPIVHEDGLSKAILIWLHTPSNFFVVSLFDNLAALQL